MHNILVATLFIAMVLGPCVVAMLTGVEHADDASQPGGPDPVIAVQPSSASFLNDR